MFNIAGFLKQYCGDEKNKKELLKYLGIDLEQYKKNGQFVAESIGKLDAQIIMLNDRINELETILSGIYESNSMIGEVTEIDTNSSDDGCEETATCKDADEETDELIENNRQIDGENYYYVNTSLNTVEYETEWHFDEDDTRFHSGNYFKTYAEAEKFARVLETRSKLRTLALELNKGEKVDFENDSQFKYYLSYSYESENINQSAHTWFKLPDTIYCLDRDFMLEAIDRIGKEKLIEYLTYEL